MAEAYSGLKDDVVSVELPAPASWKKLVFSLNFQLLLFELQLEFCAGDAVSGDLLWKYW